MIDSSGCSYALNATFEFSYYEWNNQTNSIEEVVETEYNNMPFPLGADTCIKGYDNSTGKYYSRLAFCSDVLQLGFLASYVYILKYMYLKSKIFFENLHMMMLTAWGEKDVTSRCDGKPTVVATITDYDEFSCNVAAGSCDNLLLRMSEFESDVCEYGVDYNEIRIATNKCWIDDDTNLVAKCGTDTGSSDMNIAQYNVYDTTGCPNDPVFILDIEDGKCYDMENDPPTEQMGFAHVTNFQILECMDYIAPGEEIPDCMFIENPSWIEKQEDNYCDDGWGNWEPCERERTDNQEFTVPIGVCMTNAREEGAESKYVFLGG